MSEAIPSKVIVSVAEGGFVGAGVNDPPPS